MASVTQSLPIPASLGRRTLSSELRALFAVARKEWFYFIRYPTWVVALVIWPIIFPLAYILSARALSGPDGSGLVLFTQATGVQDYLGYIVVGTTIWMWQNMVLWNIGFALRMEQWRGTLESNWLSPTWRFSFLLGNTGSQMVTMFFFLVVSAVEFGLFFGVRLHGNGWLVLLMFLAAIPSIYGLGFVFASLVIAAKEANAFVYLVRGFVMIFCGITYPLSVLPGWMQKWHNGCRPPISSAVSAKRPWQMLPLPTCCQSSSRWCGLVSSGWRLVLSYSTGWNGALAAPAPSASTERELQ
jgi:ABC-2 type transport system permease protein